jgi:hypothetical protein
VCVVAQKKKEAHNKHIPGDNTIFSLLHDVFIHSGSAWGPSNSSSVSVDHCEPSSTQPVGRPRNIPATYFAASSAASAGSSNFCALAHLLSVDMLPCSTCGGTQASGPTALGGGDSRRWAAHPILPFAPVSLHVPVARPVIAGQQHPPLLLALQRVSVRELRRTRRRRWRTPLPIGGRPPRAWARFARRLVMNLVSTGHASQ